MYITFVYVYAKMYDFTGVRLLFTVYAMIMLVSIFQNIYACRMNRIELKRNTTQ